MELLSAYFSNLIFASVDVQNSFRVYAACVGKLGNSKNYILLHVPNSEYLPNRANIRDLNYVCLSTRKLVNSYRLPMQILNFPENLPNPELIVSDRNPNFSVYVSNSFPFPILLLHDSKKKTKYQYHNRLALTSCLNTFMTVIKMGTNPQPTPSNLNTLCDSVGCTNIDISSSKTTPITELL